ncbi:hypothetical protein ACFVYJ_01440 [Pontibacter sp. JAM-7]|uniref:hypothetical protein n=1 Tax=Pontibacter sp. JAM-7 TaxID=3366581 RepID=UPI003AF49BF9
MTQLARQITRTIKSDADKQHLVRYLVGIDQYPMHVAIKPGKEPRSLQQNRLQFQWMNDAEGQGDHTATEYRALCKLHFGVPLLCEHDEEFREAWQRILDMGLTYEQRLYLMGEPVNMPITSRMSVAVMTQYLNRIWDHFTGKGFVLTDPAQMGIEDYQKWLGESER